jgi:peroxiredoxin Q/BCP
MRKEYDQFKSRGVEILAIGPNTHEAFQDYWAKENFPFIGLPDPDHRVALMYRQEVNLFKLGRMPMLCVVDGSGRIRYAHYSASMSDIPENQILLGVLDELNAAS